MIARGSAPTGRPSTRLGAPDGLTLCIRAPPPGAGVHFWCNKMQIVRPRARRPPSARAHYTRFNGSGAQRSHRRALMKPLGRAANLLPK